MREPRDPPSVSHTFIASHERKLPEMNSGPGLVILGGGGHALVVAEALILLSIPIRGCLDDAPDPYLCRDLVLDTRIPLLGTLHQIACCLKISPWILALGDLSVRRRLLDSAALAGSLERARTVIHPQAWVSPSAHIGRGVYIGPGAIIHSRAAIADHAIINSGVIVEHDCRVGENCHIAPGTVLGGGTHVEQDSLLGIGARTLPSISIASSSTVGAGAVVIRDIREPGCTHVGVPCRAPD